jgi:hypothetical protein
MWAVVDGKKLGRTYLHREQFTRDLDDGHALLSCIYTLIRENALDAALRSARKAKELTPNDREIAEVLTILKANKDRDNAWNEALWAAQKIHGQFPKNRDILKFLTAHDAKENKSNVNSLRTRLGLLPLSVDYNGYMIIMAGKRSKDGRPSIENFTRRAEEFTSMGIEIRPWMPMVVSSGNYPGLRPGFTIVVLGVCGKQELKEILLRLRRINPDIYARRVKWHDMVGSCPQLRPPEPLSESRLASVRLGLKDTSGTTEIADKSRAILADLPFDSWSERFGKDALCYAAWGLTCETAREELKPKLHGSEEELCSTLSISGDGKAEASEIGVSDNNEARFAYCEVSDNHFDMLLLFAKKNSNETWMPVDAIFRPTGGQTYLTTEGVQLTQRTICIALSLTIDHAFYHSRSTTYLQCYQSRRDSIGYSRVRDLEPVVAWEEHDVGTICDCEGGYDECGECSDESTHHKFPVRHWKLVSGEASDVLCIPGEIETENGTVHKNSRRRDSAFKIFRSRAIRLRDLSPCHALPSPEKMDEK